MKIERPKLLKEFALPGLCEICKETCGKREAHHLRSRTPSLDIRINLISVGSTLSWECDCHSSYHAGKIPPNRILEIVAAREKVKVDDVTTVMDLFRRLIKPTQSQLVKAVNELAQESARKLAFREIDEAGILA